MKQGTAEKTDLSQVKIGDTIVIPDKELKARVTHIGKKYIYCTALGKRFTVPKEGRWNL